MTSSHTVHNATLECALLKAQHHGCTTLCLTGISISHAHYLQFHDGSAQTAAGACAALLHTLPCTMHAYSHGGVLNRHGSCRQYQGYSLVVSYPVCLKDGIIWI